VPVIVHKLTSPGQFLLRAAHCRIRAISRTILACGERIPIIRCLWKRGCSRPRLLFPSRLPNREVSISPIAISIRCSNEHRSLDVPTALSRAEGGIDAGFVRIGGFSARHSALAKYHEITTFAERNYADERTTLKIRAAMVVAIIHVAYFLRGITRASGPKGEVSRGARESPVSAIALPVNRKHGSPFPSLRDRWPSLEREIPLAAIA